MKYKIIGDMDYEETEWSGGVTRQLYIYPPEETYPDGQYQVRISSARVDNEVSKFTKLDKVKRFLMVLQGHLKIVYDEDAIQYVNQYEIISFLGHWNTVSYGKATDFNLMLKNGADGKMNFYNLKKNETVNLNDEDKKYDKIFIYIIEGFGDFENNRICKCDSILIEDMESDICNISNKYDDDLKIGVCKIVCN